MRVLLVLILIPLLGFALPLYRRINPKGFKPYLIYCLLISLIWICLVIGTNCIING